MQQMQQTQHNGNKNQLKLILRKLFASITTQTTTTTTATAKTMRQESGKVTQLAKLRERPKSSVAAATKKTQRQGKRHTSTIQPQSVAIKCPTNTKENFSFTFTKGKPKTTSNKKRSIKK